MKKLVSVICSLAIALVAFAGKPLPKEVKGTVSDVQGNPIAGAVVSDGYQVVLTDAE